MYANLIVQPLLLWRQQKMPKNKTALAGLIVLCFTFLCSLWLVRDSLCEVRYQDGSTSFLAQFVVYETAVR